jgi:hypothetical protein
VESAGAHWLYCHPFCLGWGTGHLVQAQQEQVRARIEVLQQACTGEFKIHFGHERYEYDDLNFEQYHAAHFLMVVGADGKNYLGTEVKYQPEYVIADLSVGWRNGFLWEPARQAKIASYNQSNYASVGGRHRALLYNHYIQQLIRGEEKLKAREAKTDETFLFPNIL